MTYSPALSRQEVDRGHSKNGKAEWCRGQAACIFSSSQARRARNGSPRIVRVGESSNLQSRLLDQHLNGTHRDDHRDENGVFRSSRFRKYVGAVLNKHHTWSARHGWIVRSPAVLPTAGAERGVERRVTRVIGAMPAVWAPAHPDRSQADREESDRPAQ